METFTNEWILRQVLKPRADRPRRVTVTLLDTAQSERDSLAAAKERIETRRDEIEEELRETETGALGSLTVETRILTDDVLLQAGQDLTGPDVVSEVADHHAMDPTDWWLRPEDVDEELDLARGVFRERAMAKAIYYKADAVDREIDNLVDMHGNGRAAVLVGLGGGTGAGMALDVAEGLAEEAEASNISLFGVLPTPREESRAGANAFGALSELERVQVDRENPLFRDVVLLPIDPTEYQGKRGNSAATLGALEEFDEAFPYVLTAYYNSRQENIFGQSPDCAPFTIAIPQVQRYNVGEVERIRDDLETALEDLDDLLEAAIEMHRRTRELIHEQYDADGTGLTDEQRRDIEEWLAAFESFAGRRLFAEFEYTATTKFEEVIAEAVAEADDIEGQVDSLEALTRNLDDESLNFVDQFDRSVADTLKRAARFLNLRRKTLEDISAVEDEVARSALTETLDIGHGEVNDALLRFRRLDNEIEDLEEEFESVADRLDRAEAELETARQERADTIERKLETWRSETATARSQLEAAAETSLETPFLELESALESFARALENAGSEDAVAEVGDESVRESLDRIEELSAAVGFERPDTDLPRRDAVERSLETLRDARVASLNADPDLGRLQRLAPWNTDDEQAARRARERLKNKRNSLAVDGVFEAYGSNDTSFGVEVTYDPSRGVSLLRNHLEGRRRGCIEVLEEVISGSLSEERRAELAHRLDQGQSVTDMVRAAITDHVPEPTDIEAEVRELRDEYRRLDARLERLAGVASLVDAFIDDGARTEVDEAYASVNPELSGPEQSQSVRSDSEYTYVRSVKPDGLYDTVGQPDVATAGLLSAPDQRQQLGEQIDEFVDNVVSNRYNGLNRRAITSGERRYTGTKLHVCFQSRAADQLSDEHISVGRSLTTPFGLEQGAEDFSNWRLNLGGAWDLAMTVFVDGVPLDNVRNVQEYLDAYRARERSDDSIHFHHTLGLSDGRFTRRRELVNMKDPDQTRLFTDFDEETVVEALTDRYQTWVEAPSTPLVEMTGDDSDDDVPPPGLVIDDDGRSAGAENGDGTPQESTGGRSPKETNDRGDPARTRGADGRRAGWPGAPSERPPVSDAVDHTSTTDDPSGVGAPTPDRAESNPDGGTEAATDAPVNHPESSDDPTGGAPDESGESRDIVGDPFEGFDEDAIVADRTEADGGGDGADGGDGAASEEVSD